jgi:hypothetical protein
MTSQQVSLFSIIVALFLICVNEIQTVKILVNYAFTLVESVEHENPAVSGGFFWPKSGLHEVNIFHPTLLNVQGHQAWTAYSG